MRAYVLAVVLAGALSATAAAQPTARKQAPADKFTKAAGAAFAEAVAAEERDDLRGALTLYQKAFLIEPHPSTMFNIAAIERRLDQIEAAIKSFEMYLALSPNASDRAAVEALVAKLEKTPTTIHLKAGDPRNIETIDLRTAYILIDGKIEARPGTEPRKLPNGDFALTFDVPPGEHVVDVVTAITYGTTRCGSGPGERDFCTVQARPRLDGQLVISASHRRIEARERGKRPVLTYHRVDLPAGRHKLHVEDRSYECAPLVVDVPRGDDVAYVFVTTKDHEVARCRKLGVERQKLTF